MWHVDIILDLAWLSDRDGSVVTPRTKTIMRAVDPGIVTEIGLYGDDFAIRHVRVVMHTEDQDTAQRCVNTYVQQWVSRIGVASGFLSHSVAKPVPVARNASEIMLLFKPGGFEAPVRHVTLPAPEPRQIDYRLAARMLAAWKPEFTHQLFYLARFFDTDLPLEVRWLNGYRSIEWHFCRGNGDLPKNKDYQAFVDAHGDGFDELCRPNQRRTPLIEEARALAAHAVEYRVADPRTLGGKTNLLTRSFKPLEALICALLNLGAAEGVAFQLGSTGKNATQQIADNEREPR